MDRNRNYVSSHYYSTDEVENSTLQGAPVRYNNNIISNATRGDNSYQRGSLGELIQGSRRLNPVSTVSSGFYGADSRMYDPMCRPVTPPPYGMQRPLYNDNNRVSPPRYSTSTNSPPRYNDYTAPSSTTFSSSYNFSASDNNNRGAGRQDFDSHRRKSSPDNKRRRAGFDTKPRDRNEASNSNDKRQSIKSLALRAPENRKAGNSKSDLVNLKCLLKDSISLKAQLELAKKPIIGLDHVIEYIDPADESFRIYHCSLCKISRLVHTFMDHLTSHHHRVKFIRKLSTLEAQHYLERDGRSINKGHNFARMADERAKELELIYGRGDMVTKYELPELEPDDLDQEESYCVVDENEKLVFLKDSIQKLKKIKVTSDEMANILNSIVATCNKSLVEFKEPTSSKDD